MPPICCHASSSQFCHVSHPRRKGRCATPLFSGRINGTRVGIHRFSQGLRRKHTAPSPFKRGTELQHDAALAVPRPSDAVRHSAPRSSSKGRAQQERTQTSDSRTDLFSTHWCAPHDTGAQQNLQSVTMHDCKRDIVCGGAVALGVPHPLRSDGYCLRTVESRRATRRCPTPRGTASPDAVPQLGGC